MNIEQLFAGMVEQGASDLHIATGMPPMYRLIGDLKPLEHPPVTEEQFQLLVQSMLSDKDQARFHEDMEIDFALSFMDRYRLRVAFYRYLHGYAAAFRMIPSEIVPLERLGLPPVVKSFTQRGSGLVLAVGPTGCGKSTTLASMLDVINSTKNCHIITIEDPIEFVHENNLSYVTQRELGSHTRTFTSALKSSLREDPDVVLVGEMRDAETMELALMAAETGHLVLATAHASSATECIDRIISAFPAANQSTVRMQLHNTLVGIIFQMLIPAADGKNRVLAPEIIVGTQAVRNIIREEKTHQLASVMQTGIKEGMRSLDQSLMDLLMKRKINQEEARKRMRHQKLPPGGARPMQAGGAAYPQARGGAPRG